MAAPSLAPIPTRYAGCRFRSRLEARWAVFFDVLGCRWVYEPEGFDLPNTGNYLPDFWVEDFPVQYMYGGETYKTKFWVEVKPDVPRLLSTEDFKLKELALLTGHYVYVATYQHLQAIVKACQVDPLIRGVCNPFGDEYPAFPQPNYGFSFAPVHWWAGRFSMGKMPDKYYEEEGIFKCEAALDAFHKILDESNCAIRDAPFSDADIHDPIIWRAAAQAALSARFEHGECGPT